MKKIALTISILMSMMSYAQNEGIFEQANQLYNDGKYLEAIEKYTTILETKQHSAALYYNLANAHYKLNNIAPSIYYYEKALLIAPNDSDIKNNLAFAQNMTIDSIETIPQTGFSKIFNNLIDKFSYETWSYLSILFMLIFAITFLIYYFSITQRKKRLFFILSIISVFMTVTTIIFSFKQYSNKKNNTFAIIFAEETQALSEPNFRSDEVFILHEGTKIQVLDQLNDWKKIRLSNGKIGWIPAEAIKEL